MIERRIYKGHAGGFYGDLSFDVYLTFLLVSHEAKRVGVYKNSANGHDSIYYLRNGVVLKHSVKGKIATLDAFGEELAKIGEVERRVHIEAQRFQRQPTSRENF
ncbi:MAG TPA: hypothetical protein VJG30_03285 [Candidatus Nanoarchaeia archaeon]|nr:hypothetical protein [Candidatus Nanoarchaeia archaeon]